MGIRADFWISTKSVGARFTTAYGLDMNCKLKFGDDFECKVKFNGFVKYILALVKEIGGKIAKFAEAVWIETTAAFEKTGECIGKGVDAVADGINVGVQVVADASGEAVKAAEEGWNNAKDLAEEKRKEAERIAEEKRREAERIA